MTSNLCVVLVLPQPLPLTSFPINHQACSFYPLRELSNPRPCPCSRPSPCPPPNFSLPTGLSLSPTHLPISSPQSSLDPSQHKPGIGHPPQPWHRPTLIPGHRSAVYCGFGHTAPAPTKPVTRLFSSPWSTPHCPSPGPEANSSHPPCHPHHTGLSPTHPSSGLLSGAT